MLPATLCYVPVIVCVWGYFLWTFFVVPYLYRDHYWYDGHLGALYYLLALVVLPYLQMAFTVWQIPLAVVAILLLHKN